MRRPPKREMPNEERIRSVFEPRFIVPRAKQKIVDRKRQDRTRKLDLTEDAHHFGNGSPRWIRKTTLERSIFDRFWTRKLLRRPSGELPAPSREPPGAPEHPLERRHRAKPMPVQKNEPPACHLGTLAPASGSPPPLAPYTLQQTLKRIFSPTRNRPARRDRGSADSEGLRPHAPTPKK